MQVTKGDQDELFAYAVPFQDMYSILTVQRHARGMVQILLYVGIEFLKVVMNLNAHLSMVFHSHFSRRGDGGHVQYLLFEVD